MVSSKYKMLYPPLVERIYQEEAKKNPKDIDKAVKTKLHQMFGAYIQGNAHKKATQLEDVEKIMALHASTKERLPYLADFCSHILSHTGAIASIMDLGCGFNPFSLDYWQGLTTYYAYDIDLRTSTLLNGFFATRGLPPYASCADLTIETPTAQVDLALMCKLVPVLEMQCPGRGFALANALNTKFLAITYPLKSLGGRNKGMGKNYANQFENALANQQLSNFSLINTKEIGNELVYILQNIV